MSKETMPTLGYLRWLPGVQHARAQDLELEERDAIRALEAARARLEAARKAGDTYARAHWKRAEIQDAKRLAR